MFCPKCGTEQLANNVFCHMCGTKLPSPPSNPEDDYNKGLDYAKGNGVAKDLVKANEYFEKAAQAGHAKALHELAWSYQKGRGCQQNYQEALRLYKLAASKGNTSSENQVGIFFDNGWGVSQNSEEAFRWYEQSAYHGDSTGMYNCGLCYKLGDGITKDYEKALYWIKQSANKEYPNAENELGIFYENGWSVPQNYSEATKWYEKAANHGLAVAMYNLGILYKDGKGTNQDYTKAFHWLQQAATNNYADAENQVGLFYDKGWGVPQNDFEAFKWYERAANHGLTVAMYNLGVLYKDGRGTNQDYTKAFHWLQQAATNNYADAENQIGLFYGKGWGVPQNDFEAFKWYERAANHGLAAAMYNLGSFYKDGRGTNQDYTKALYWFQKATEAGDNYAYNDLGVLYFYGRGVLQNYNMAYMYFEKGAAAGHNNAKRNMAYMLMEGLGVSQDLPRALKLYEELVAANYEGADKDLEECKKQLAEQTAQRNNTSGNANNTGCSGSSSGTSNNSGTNPPEDDYFADFDDFGDVEENTRPPRQMPENLDKYFDGLIGMSSVKNQLETIYNKILAEKKKREIWEKMGRSVESSIQSYNFALLGNPGTGKTVVARAIAEFLYDVGIRDENKLVETDRNGLVEGYIGQTASKTMKMIEQAMGGTLFIDEAYSLYVEDSSKDFGKEAIDTLLKQMEDRRGDFSVIMAGYKEPMLNMMKKANIGFESRISYIIEIPDYSDDDLVEIAHSMLDKKGYRYDETLDDSIRKCIRRDRIDPKSFGNARYIRQLLDKSLEEQSNRVLSLPADANEMEYITLKGSDLWKEQGNADTLEKYLEELHALTGLTSVKRQVQELIDSKRTIQELERRGIKTPGGIGNLHMVFLGNPGTGKTTVARIIGKLYSSLGLLKRSDVFVETSRVDLVASYTGQTAKKVIDKVAEAKGGILFIDEAYSLVKDSQDNFGKEAVDTLIKEMEDNRDNLVVILAGYSDTMEKFFEIANPGLKSRVPNELDFEDYTIDQLMEIAKGMLKKNNHSITEDAYTSLKEIILDEMQTDNFGNARSVRNIIEKVERNQMARVSRRLNELTDEELTTITIEDVDSLPRAKQSEKSKIGF